jgi:hypothetical protein
METGKEEHVKAIVSRIGITITVLREDLLIGIAGTTVITGKDGSIVITGIVEMLVKDGNIAMTVITEIIEIIVREESIVIITVIQTVKTVVKDVRKIRIETEKIDSKTEIVTRTGEMIVGSREIGMIEEIVANGFPSVPRDRLITRRHPEVYTARKSKSSFARKTRDRKQNCA